MRQKPDARAVVARTTITWVPLRAPRRYLLCAGEQYPVCVWEAMMKTHARLRSFFTVRLARRQAFWKLFLVPSPGQFPEHQETTPSESLRND
jgi:hypothetical protein